MMTNATRVLSDHPICCLHFVMSGSSSLALTMLTQGSACDPYALAEGCLRLKRLKPKDFSGLN